MKKIFFFFLLMLLSGFSLHKYYVSVTEVNIKPGKLEIIIRTFPDDIQNVLTDTYQIKADVEILDSHTVQYLKMYLLEHFQLAVDHKEVPYTFSVFTTQDGFFIILLEAKMPENYSSIRLKNTLLQDMFDEQKNIVHFIDGDRKESFILTKDNRIAVYKIQ